MLFSKVRRNRECGSRRRFTTTRQIISKWCVRCMHACDTQQPCGKGGQWVHKMYTTHRDAEMASYCSLFPPVFRWKSWRVGYRRRWKYKWKSTLYIWLTITRETHDLSVFWGGKKSVPTSSSLWALGQARGGRKKRRRRDEEEREGRKAGESRQDLWGLQGCMEQMQYNLTLPQPNIIPLSGLCIQLSWLENIVQSFVPNREIRSSYSYQTTTFVWFICPFILNSSF